jgi:hypothetical protein
MCTKHHSNETHLLLGLHILALFPLCLRTTLLLLTLFVSSSTAGALPAQTSHSLHLLVHRPHHRSLRSGLSGVRVIITIVAYFILALYGAAQVGTTISNKIYVLHGTQEAHGLQSVRLRCIFIWNTSVHFCALHTVHNWLGLF